MRCPSSNVFYALLLVCGLPAIALKGVTDGRSMGAFALVGLIAIWAGICSVTGHDTLYEAEGRASTSGRKRPALDAAFYRGTQGVAGVIVGAAFVVIGVLAAFGKIDIG